MNLTHYSGDDLVISIPVNFDAGAPVQSLTGGAAVAVARRQGSGTVVNGSTVIQASGAEVIVTFSDGVFTAGVYAVQVRATVSGITQTLLDASLTVVESL